MTLAAAAGPVPAHHSANVGGGWALRVDRGTPATWIADGRVFPAPAGEQEFLVRLTLRRTGAGAAAVAGLLPRVWLHGAHGGSSTFYGAQIGGATGCSAKDTPRKWRQIAGRVGPGEVLNGQVCFQVDPADVRSLQLRVLDPSCSTAPLLMQSCSKYVSFALR